MTISDEERQEILKAAKFLEEKGYTIKEDDEHIISYTNGTIEIIIYYERYGDYVEVSIKLSKQKHYDVNYIA